VTNADVTRLYFQLNECTAVQQITYCMVYSVTVHS